VATIVLFTDNANVQCQEVRGRKALFVHYQPDASRYDEKPRDAETCADVLLMKYSHVTRLNNITLCPALATGIYSLWYTLDTWTVIFLHYYNEIRWHVLVRYATYPDNS